MADVLYRITPRLQTGLLLTRAILESTNQDFAFFDATIARLHFTQEFSPKLSAFVEGIFELDEFKERVSPGEPRRRFDRLYGFGGGGDYQFARWLTTRLSYLYSTKDSNVPRLDYVDHRVMLRFTLRF